MPTFEEIKNLSDEEVAELNKKYGKLIMKKFAIGLAVTAAVHVGVNLLMKKVENSETANDATPEN
jgi:hypothetical protein